MLRRDGSVRIHCDGV